MFKTAESAEQRARKKGNTRMGGHWSPDLWGTPVGSGTFTFLRGGGTGMFFWGVSKLPREQE